LLDKMRFKSIATSIYIGYIIINLINGWWGHEAKKI